MEQPIYRSIYFKMFAYIIIQFRQGNFVKINILLHHAQLRACMAASRPSRALVTGIRRGVAAQVRFWGTPTATPLRERGPGRKREELPVPHGPS